MVTVNVKCIKKLNILSYSWQCMVCQSFLKNHVTRNKHPTRRNVLYLVVALPSRISQKPALNTPTVELGAPVHLDTINCWDLRPTLGTENSKVGDVLLFPSKCF